MQRAREIFSKFKARGGSESRFATDKQRRRLGKRSAGRLQIERSEQDVENFQKSHLYRQFGDRTLAAIARPSWRDAPSLHRVGCERFAGGFFCRFGEAAPIRRGGVAEPAVTFPGASRYDGVPSGQLSVATTRTNSLGPPSNPAGSVTVTDSTGVVPPGVSLAGLKSFQAPSVSDHWQW